MRKETELKLKDELKKQDKERRKCDKTWIKKG